MLHTYLIYQRVLDDELMEIIQGNRNKPMADAYFNLMHMHKTYAEDGPTPEEMVKKGMMYSLYQPTMFMQYATGKSVRMDALEYIFAEGNGIPEQMVKKGIIYSLYQPTMFMQYATGKSVRMDALEYIFAEGNGMGADGPIKTTHLMKHPSLSVGDLVVSLLDNDTFVCMPQGWHQLEDTTLELNVA